MTTTLKEKRDYLRTAAGFTAVALVAAGLIWLGNRNDAITEAERLKSGILTAHQLMLPSQLRWKGILRAVALILTAAHTNCDGPHQPALIGFE